jgi:hypothetical protein
MTGPTRRSQIVARTALAMVILGVGLTMCASPRAADLQIERVWVLWDETRNAAWISPKGRQSASTTATACALATVEAAQHSPAGTRLACRKSK